jgi:hypothetical protein
MQPVRSEVLRSQNTLKTIADDFLASRRPDLYPSYNFRDIADILDCPYIFAVGMIRPTPNQSPEQTAVGSSAIAAHLPNRRWPGRRFEATSTFYE